MADGGFETVGKFEGGRSRGTEFPADGGAKEGIVPTGLLIELLLDAKAKAIA